MATEKCAGHFSSVWNLLARDLSMKVVLKVLQDSAGLICRIWSVSFPQEATSM